MSKENTLSLPDPTVELVREKIAAFDDDQDTSVEEYALGLLLNQYPKNTDPAHVFLKVTAINALYSTQIYAIKEMARQVAKLGSDGHLDNSLNEGSIEIVDEIAHLNLSKDSKKPRVNISFASKYCSWHRQDCYPIYDRHAESCLWAYRNRDKFKEYKRYSCDVYAKYVENVNAFRSYYHLENIGYKDLDKFLYLQGGEILDEKKPKRSE